MASAKFVPTVPNPKMVELMLNEAEAAAVYQVLSFRVLSLPTFPSGDTYAVYSALHNLLKQETR